MRTKIEMKDKKKFFTPELYSCNNNINKRWYIFYYVPEFGGFSKKRIKVYGGINRKKSAKERLKCAEALIAKIKAEKPWQKKFNCEKSILQVTLELTSGFINKKTFTTYQGMLEKFKNFLKDKPDHEATRADSTSFLNELIQSGKSMKTVKSYRNNLSALYNKSIEMGNNLQNPFSKIKLQKSNSKSLMYFTDAQIKRIKDFTIKYNPKLWLAIQLQYYCFIRPNELRQLKAKHINLAAGFIEIDSSISKNKKTQKVQIPRTFQNQLQFIEKLSGESNIFTHSEVKTPVRDFYSKEHNKALKILGINGRYGFYSWKHTGVVMAWKASINIKDLQMQLRHHSLDMVNEYLKNLGVMDSERIRDLFPSI